MVVVKMMFDGIYRRESFRENQSDRLLKKAVDIIIPHHVPRDIPARHQKR